MSKLFLPLQGPGGTRPKAPSEGAWQSPGYAGLTHAEASARYESSNHAAWFGMRTDGLVVIDCDTHDAYEFWIEHTFPHKTWIRKTPRGWHFIYAQSEGSPDAPAAGIFDHVDIRAGRTSQIVYFAPNYHDVTPSNEGILPFNVKWLPEVMPEQASVWSHEDWAELPDGRGNNVMTAIAGAMRKQGMGRMTMAKCLGAINAITMTQDPMPPAMIVDIVNSVSRYKADPDIDLVVE